MDGPSVGSIFAGCRIESIAGRGGMGVVYKATQLALNRPVALKAIAPDVLQALDFQQRFKHEAMLAASIDHPNVVPVYEAGEIDGQLYLVMRWVDGTDMRVLIDRGMPREPARSARLVAQVASALGAAHAKGLMHRDVKPANVLVSTVDDTEHAYLTDFGIARLEHATSGLTQTGSVLGTIDYMPPERIEGATGDGRSDIYSLGCVLYELLSGEPPFPRDNEIARLYAHLNAEVPWAADARADVPRALAEVARRAMAKRPEERYQSAGEMVRALLDAGEPSARGVPAPTAAAATVPASRPSTRAAPEQDTEAASTVPLARSTAATRPAPRPGSGRRRGVLMIAGGLVAAAIVGLVVLLAGGGGDESPPLAAAGVAIPVPGKPDGLEAGGGQVWVAGAEGSVVSRIDAATGEKLGDPIPVGGDPDSIAVGTDAVWVTNNDDGTVSRIDRGSGQVVEKIQVGEGPEGIALDGDGAPWVALIGEGGVRRIDPQSNHPDPIVSTGKMPHAVLADGDRVWVANRGGGTVAHFERPGGAVTTVEVGGRPRDLAVAGSSLWVVDVRNRLVELDRESGARRDEMALEGEPREIAAGEGALWVTLNKANELARVDLASRSVSTRAVPRGPVGVAIAADRVWVASHAAGSVTPFAP